MSLILVAEDEYGTAEALKLMLELRGYRVVLAGDGREALRRVDEQRPDLVLSDYVMPEMGGAELGRALRARADCARVPMIMTSSNAEAVVRREFSGYDRFLRKPYSARVLLGLVAELLVQRGH